MRNLEKWISELKDIEKAQINTNMEEELCKAKKTIHVLNDPVKGTNIKMIEVPGGMERESELQDVFI